MIHIEKPKAALQPAQNRANLNEQVNHQRPVVTDKLGNPIQITRHQELIKRSENDDFLKQPSYDNVLFKPLKGGSPKEPSPPRLRNHTRTTRATAKLLEQHKLKEELLQTEKDDKQELPKLQPLIAQDKRQLRNVVTLPEATTLNASKNVIPTALSAVSRIPRLSRAPAHFNLLQLIPKQESVEKVELEEKSMQIVEEELEEILDIDKSCSNDALFLCFDYVKDIYEYLRQLEASNSIRENYLRDQKIFTPKVRQRLINWCIEIHQQLRLLPETLYLTIATLDRFFQSFNVTQQNQVQLVALGATMIASKYEEIYPPDVNDLIHLSQNTYTKRELLRVEMTILKVLNFDLGMPIPLSFLRRFSRAAQCDLKMHGISKYLMELSLTEYECAHWVPSLLAAAAIFVTLQVTRNSCSTIKMGDSIFWDRTMVHYTNYERADLIVPAGILCKILKRAQRLPYSFQCSKKNMSNLSKWPELKSAKIDQIIKMSEK